MQHQCFFPPHCRVVWLSLVLSLHMDFLCHIVFVLQACASAIRPGWVRIDPYSCVTNKSVHAHGHMCHAYDDNICAAEQADQAEQVCLCVLILPCNWLCCLPSCAPCCSHQKVAPSLRCDHAIDCLVDCVGVVSQ